MSETTSSIEQNKLFVGNLHWNIRRQELKEFFSQRGEVAYASVSLDRESNKSRGFGFVTFVNEADAQKAQEEGNEQELSGRKMYIDFARAREEVAEENTSQDVEAEEGAIE